ncbi:hypothetical protein AX16_009274 [Volvariella volvacea WC 439]|nr:hypothetical protein AX16_009274 [Volvariella volvacea WC 439]
MAGECGKKLTDNAVVTLLQNLSSSSYDNLYDDVWVNGEWPFDIEDIVRPYDKLDHIIVPSRVRVFRSLTSICDTISCSAKCHPLVRDEHPIVLSDIEARTKGSEVFQRPLDNLTTRQENELSTQIQLDPINNPSQSDQKKPHHGTQFPNPFEQEHGDRALDVVSILGHSGIGKTIFLFYTLLLRLHAKKPTLLVMDPHTVTLFLSGGAFNLPLTAISVASPIVPRDTWCLVDSISDIEDVPGVIVRQDLFTIQAASPRPNCVRWLGKTVETDRYVMCSFSLAELVIAYEAFPSSLNPY